MVRYTEILTRDEVKRLIAPHPNDVTGFPLLLRRLADSHELLWVRVVELNQEIEGGKQMSNDKRLNRPDNDAPRPDRASPEELRDWETLQQNQNDATQRLRVHGGYLYRTVLGVSDSVAMVYVPDAPETEA